LTSEHDRTPTDHIRNFAIIAHIDHGKSTLADRLIQYTGALSDREMTNSGPGQHGAGAGARHHIKAQTVRLSYNAKNGETYELNLMDTPGHVDFAMRSAAASPRAKGRCWSSMPAGVEAQTLANATRRSRPTTKSCPS